MTTNKKGNYIPNTNEMETFYLNEEIQIILDIKQALMTSPDIKNYSGAISGLINKECLLINEVAKIREKLNND